eukprot:TRINITY_DN1529_c0_g2_i3.p2 TRINITY_DN1529_c0_g2~~TRINITY_DN1529_c0_g2_i3.p2  ORF type:complete len:108 (+),score=5.50 TRINITY_DN1529_c0_g2_i3:23-346(+)
MEVYAMKTINPKPKNIISTFATQIIQNFTLVISPSLITNKYTKGGAIKVQNANAKLETIPTKLSTPGISIAISIEISHKSKLDKNGFPFIHPHLLSTAALAGVDATM